ncbi:MAG TPA: hypothetical protein DCM71_03755 [Runella sp.]|nr:hypothetical protein [Runella sp.]
MKPPVILLQQRDFGQKINATFDFVVQNFKPLAISLLYIAGPLSLVGGFFMGSYQSGILEMQKSVLESGSSSFDGIYQMVGTVFLLSFFLILANIISSLVIGAYFLEYEAGNRNITPEIVWNRLKGYIGKALIFNFVMGIAVVAGIVFFLLPGIYLGVTLSLMTMILMRENLDLGDTFRRCFYLIKDKWWSTFGLLFVMGIVSSIIGYAFQIPTLILTVMSSLQVKLANTEVLMTISGVIATVGGGLVRSLVLIAIVFQYYNLVERREGSGILGAIDNIGKTDTPRTDLREEEF